MAGKERKIAHLTSTCATACKKRKSESSTLKNKKERKNKERFPETRLNIKLNRKN